MSDDSVYREICQNIRVTDDISFKLLGFVPLISGAGVVIALLNSDVLWSPAIYLISILGAGITFGLFRWELKNILICNWLIHCAAQMESLALKEEHVGQYYRRPEPPGLLRRKPGVRRKPGESKGSLLVRSFGKTEAEKLVYSLAIFSWLALPGIVYASASSDSRLARPVWAVILTVLYLLLTIVLVILTLSALGAEVTHRSPISKEEAKGEITVPVAAGIGPQNVSHSINQKSGVEGTAES